MKKRIGTKIVLLVGILSLIFILFGIANVAAISEINERNGEIADVYLELRKIEGQMSVQVQEFRNLMDTTKLKTQGGDAVKQKVSLIKDYLAQMEALCKKTSDQALNESFASYKQHFEEMLKMYVPDILMSICPDTRLILVSMASVYSALYSSRESPSSLLSPKTIKADIVSLLSIYSAASIPKDIYSSKCCL